MNHINVTAHGAPNSFIRSVQEDPTIAAELLDVLMHINAYDSHSLGSIGESLVRHVIQKALDWPHRDKV